MNQRTSRAGRTPRAWRVAAGVTAVAALLAGCRPAGGTFERQAKQVQRTAPDTRPWFCNATGQGTPPSGHGNGAHVHPYYQGKTKGPLSWADCTKLAAQLDQTRTAVKGLETRAKGEAAGWRPVAQYVPGLGTHHVKMGGMPGGGMPPGSLPGSGDAARIGQCLKDKGVDLTGGVPNFSDPKVAEALKACGVQLPSGGPGGMGGGGLSTAFDPAKPPILIYGGDTPDSPLVGVAYVFMGGDTPPEAYAGGNDWWHLHTQTCFGLDLQKFPDPGDLSEEECTAAGGRFQSLGQTWLLHLWPFQPYEYQPDLFVSGHPCLAATDPAPQSDPCWADAHRDPALVPPPTTTPAGGEHGGHGEHGH
jgi:hypothetical protein